MSNTMLDLQRMDRKLLRILLDDRFWDSRDALTIHRNTLLAAQETIQEMIDKLPSPSETGAL